MQFFLHTMQLSLSNSRSQTVAKKVCAFVASFRDRTFLKRNLLKNYLTDFHTHFLLKKKKLDFFSLQFYEEFLSKFDLGKIFIAVKKSHRSKSRHKFSVEL